MAIPPTSPNPFWKPPPVQPSPQMPKAVRWVVSVVVMLLIVGGGYWLAKQTNIFQKPVPLGQPAAVSSGQVLSGVPKDLIQEPNAVKSGEKTNYAAGVQYSVSYESAKSLADNENLYREYLRKNNWSILQDAAMTKPLPYFYAVKDDGEDLNIVLQPVNQIVQVTIGYLRK